MLKLRERYIVDDSGRRVGVVLDLSDYQRLLEAAGQPKLVELPANGDEVDQPPGDADGEAALSIIGIADKLGTPEPPLIDGKPVSEHADLYLYGAGAQQRLRESNVRYRTKRPKGKSVAKGKRRKR
jgi:hypothetical protein